MTQTKKHPILLVDDEPEILFSLQGLLRREFELYTAESGAQALEILQQHPIHVIMSDQRMPEMTGVQLMHRVKDAHPDAIRIVFTGYADIQRGGRCHQQRRPVSLHHQTVGPGRIDRSAASGGRHDTKNIVEHERLLTDVRQYVQQGQQLLQGLREHSPAAEFAGVNLDEFASLGSQLLQRLDDARIQSLEIGRRHVNDRQRTVLLTVLIETSCLRWYVAGIDLDGRTAAAAAVRSGQLESLSGPPV